jgi:hypothetical protein
MHIYNVVTMWRTCRKPRWAAANARPLVQMRDNDGFGRSKEEMCHIPIGKYSRSQLRVASEVARMTLIPGYWEIPANTEYDVRFGDFAALSKQHSWKTSNSI